MADQGDDVKRLVQVARRTRHKMPLQRGFQDNGLPAGPPDFDEPESDEDNDTRTADG
jgi:hypothetical protein